MSAWNEGLTLWQERWNEGRIGFHRDAVNPHLQAHADALLEGARRVLVPLCGKSVDMPWLAERGVEVVGVELIEKAVTSFWSEMGVAPETDRLHGFVRTQSGAITLLQGDIFMVHETHIGTVDAIYDRAAIIAIPSDQQQRYADHLLGLLRPGGKMLLLTYDMPIAPEKGPPFSVAPERVPELFAAAATLECLDTVMLTPETDPKLIRRGVDWARESIWSIVR